MNNNNDWMLIKLLWSYQAVGMVADAAKNLGVDRVLLVSSCFVTPKNR